MGDFTVGQPLGYGLTEQTTIEGLQPASASSYTLNLANYDRVRLVFATFVLATSATTADRYTTIEYQGSDGIAKSVDGAALVVQASTTAQRFVGALHRGPGEWATSTDVFFPLSGVWLEAGANVKINVASIATGDQLSNIRLTFDRLLQPSQRPGYGNGADADAV